ncbi:MAG: sugar ABC transporter permease [Firmicutes bacterium]|nr:sugar ABC transporter permease [Bacillota bacterium]
MRNWIDKNIKWVLTIPVIIFIVLMVGYPLFYTFRLSFNSWSLSAVRGMKWVGLKNYINLFTSNKFWIGCKNTLVYSVVCLFFETFFGVSIAVFLNRKFRAMGIFRTMSLLPIVATPVAVSMVWKMIYDPALGILAQILSLFGIAPIAWLGNSDTALAALMVVDIWEFTPQIMLICLGGLSGIPTDCLEAASIDGASRWQSLMKITLPLLSPTILVAMMLRLIDLLKTYDQIYSTTQGGPGTATTTINILAYRQAFENFKFGDASATIVVFFGVLVLVTVMFNIFKKKVTVDY